jgi:hypothetical protein
VRGRDQLERPVEDGLETHFSWSEKERGTRWRFGACFVDELR